MFNQSNDLYRMFNYFNSYFLVNNMWFFFFFFDIISFGWHDIDHYSLEKSVYQTRWVYNTFSPPNLVSKLRSKIHRIDFIQCNFYPIYIYIYIIFKRMLQNGFLLSTLRAFTPGCVKLQKIVFYNMNTKMQALSKLEFLNFFDNLATVPS